MGKRELSDAEKEIMDFLWSKDIQSASLRDITDYLNGKLNKNQKQQTIRVYLARLKEKGYINVYIDTETNRYVYTPKITHKTYLHDLSKKIIGTFFNNSVYDFVSAFSGGEKLTEEEAEKLKKFLEE